MKKKILSIIFISNFRLFLLYAFLICVRAISTGILPYTIKMMVDNVSNHFSTTSISSYYIVMLFLCWFVAEGSMRGIIFVTIRFFPQLRSQIRTMTIEQLFNCSILYYKTHFNGEILERITNFPKSFEKFIELIFQNFLFSFINIITVLLLLGSVNIWFSFGLILTFIAHALISFYYKNEIKSCTKHNANVHARLSGEIGDTCAHIEIIQTTPSLIYESNRLKELQADEKRSYQDSLLALEKSNLWRTLVSSVMVIFFFTFSIWALIHQLITIGDFSLVVLICFNIFNQIWILNHQFSKLYFALGEVSSVLSFLKESSPRLTQGTHEISSSCPLPIEFNQVSYIYPKSKSLVLSNVSFTIKPFDKIAIIGPSGGGKSTLLHLIMHNLEPSSGSIKIGSHEIQMYCLDSLRRYFSYVPQSCLLFHRTLYENLTYGVEEVDQKHLESVLNDLNLRDLVETYGYNSVVGENGACLSQGQKQRICLARAILQNKPILILDEPNASLEQGGDSIFQTLIKKYCKNKTVIMVAHKLPFIECFHKILVLEQSQIKFDIHPHELSASYKESLL